MTSKVKWTASLLAIAAALAACGRSGPEDNTANARFDLQLAPSDAVCVQITVTGATRAATRSFNLTTGQSTASMTASGLPIGAVVITGNAYGTLCGAVTGSTQATWIVTAVNATFTVVGPNTVLLTLTRNGLLTISFDFQDDQRTVSTLAGTAGSFGSNDGIGAAARFTNPTGLAVDGSGNLYVADQTNSTIRKIVIQTGAVTTLAGLAGSPGSIDGTGTAARFNNPTGLALDGTGNLYVADNAGCIIRKVVVVTTAVTTIAGQLCNGTATDGTGLAARFQGPSGLALDAGGNLYVTDVNAVRQVVLSTNTVTTIAGAIMTASAYADGPALSARFASVNGIAFDAGALWLGDGNNVIRKLTLGAGSAVSTLAGSTASSELDGVGTAAQFKLPWGVAPDGKGNLIVADFSGNTIRKVVESSAVVVTIAGSPTAGSADGTGPAAGFSTPVWVAVDAAGAIYVSDRNNNTIRKL